MYAYQIASWNGFLSVAAQVAATLTGLIFVAVSINLRRILEFSQLVDRASESILQIIGPLIISIWALVPGQTGLVLGVGMAAAGLILWILETILQYRSFLRAHPRPMLSIAFSQLAALPFMIGGIALATETLGGLYWLAPGVILSIAVGVANAWVLLVEILR